MRSEKKEAAATTAASRNTLRTKSYQAGAPESRDKLRIGTLLLALQSPLSRRQRNMGWRLFEVLLGRYVVASQGRPDCAGRPNPEQRE